MPDGQTVSAASRNVAELVRAFPSGISERELVVEAKRQFGRLPEQRVVKLIAEAVRGGLLITSGDRLLLAAPQEPVLLAPAAPEQAEPGTQSAVDSPLDETSLLRTVALDVESVVRTKATAPYLERHVYEVAAVRFGADREWVAAAPRWQRFLRFPGDSEELRDGSVQNAVLGQGVPRQQAWTELGEFLSGADVVIAYNGEALDFPVVSEAAKQAGVKDPLSDVRAVDALYLTHAIWPAAPSHRLQDLAVQLGVPRSGLRAHTAEDDAVLLVRLLERAASEFASRAAELRALVSDVCPDSDAWRLLRELAEGESTPKREPLVWAHAHVARLLSAEFTQHAPRRTADGRAPGKGVVNVPAVLRSIGGRVEPTALARVVHGAHVEPRLA
ncbi:hypothetical protein ACFYRL_28565 [Streptomyces goshikiensis]|uniref:3'-5' exonuclease n=1 Tax=Streptomyces goshikiensis TaxID=1942 RepID=UPI00368034B6